jgi:beta-lactamase class A
MKVPSPRYLLVFGLGVVMVLGVQGVWGSPGVCERQYDLINPARRCSASLLQGEWNYEPLREALSAKKEELKAAGAVTHLSIYFQDLNHGPRFGIGEYDKFYPASLLKLPVLIFFLHAADLDPAILNKTLTLAGDTGANDNVTSPEETVMPGVPYAIRDLLRKMIVYSDNRSFVLLVEEMKSLSEDTAYITFRDLDISQMTANTDTNYVTISPFAKLFAILYNTGYLSKERSQYGLELLSETTFREGIAAGVPQDLLVAHKFGYTEVPGEKQLHDCGIVYHSKMAYILCVLTSGPESTRLNEAIIELSRMVYDDVSALDLDEQLPKSLTAL